MDTLTITKVQDLKNEISRLRQSENEQHAVLATRFSSPSAIFVSAQSLFAKPRAVPAGSLHRDYVQLISRFLIPLALNKTLFRHSNFLVRLLVGLVSQKAAGLVTERAAAKTIGKGKTLFRRLFTKKAFVIKRPILKYVEPAIEPGIIINRL